MPPIVAVVQPTATAAAAAATTAYHDDASRSTISLRLQSPTDKVGLTLRDVTIGRGLAVSRRVVAVEQVVSGGAADRAGVSPGVITLDFDNATAVTERIRYGPYPIDFKFYNLAAGGDAFGDMGKPLVSAQDALSMAESTSTSSSSTGTTPSPTNEEEEYVIRVLKPPPTSCRIQSRRGDVLEIDYEARYGSK